MLDSAKIEREGGKRREEGEEKRGGKTKGMERVGRRNDSSKRLSSAAGACRCKVSGEKAPHRQKKKKIMEYCNLKKYCNVNKKLVLRCLTSAEVW